MDRTTYRRKTQITPLPSWLIFSENFKMRLWYVNKNIEENVVDNIGIRCRNCVKTTDLYVKNKNNKETITKFVLNKVL